MKLKAKFFLPIFVAVIGLGLAGILVIRTQLATFEAQVLSNAAEEKSREVSNAVATLAAQGLEKAALFSTREDVIQALELAHLGNINEEADPMGQQARESLRALLKDDLGGFKNVSGRPMELHFHINNGRSLARMWRDKQTKRNGEWVDISDDISSFRKTVLEVNKTGKPVQGVEVGSGGFAIRGIAAIKDKHGTQLGSVETLESFDSVIKGAASGAGQSIVVYMNSSLLPIATALQDPAKNPRVGEDFVLVNQSADGELEKIVTPELLAKGRAAVTYLRSGSLAVAAFPLFDYAQTQVGVMVYAFDASSWNTAIANIGWYFLGLMVLLLLVAGGVTSVVLIRSVTRPIAQIVARIVDITEDRADLSARLPVTSKDEIGELSTWFNQLMDKIRATLSDVAAYKNIVNAISDPIFAVDNEFKILVANNAMLEIAGCSNADIGKRTCHGVMKSPMCNTDACCVHKVKQTGKAQLGDVVDLTVNGTTRSIQPFGDVLYDAENKPIGYFEIGRDVTRMVERERGLQTAMRRIEEANANILRVAHDVTSVAHSIAEQVDQAAQGTRDQSQRIDEVSSAMGQMNEAVLDVARSASDAAKAADASFEQAQGGARVVEEVVGSIAQVHERSDSLAVNMSELGQQAESIGRIMNVISDIADQTNLLALNAAIEAARAGDAGRGFAVVADEVRKLAEKTMSATKEVGVAIAGIQSGTKQTIDGMNTVTTLVQNATDLARKSGEALSEIVPLVQNTTSRITAIATASEEQSSASEEVNMSLGMVSEIAANTASGMEKAAEAVTELTRLSEELRNLAEKLQ